MTKLFSEEMEKAIIELFNKRYKQLQIDTILDTHEDVLKGIEKRIKSIESDVEDNHDAINDIEQDNEGIRLNNDRYATHKDVGEEIQQIHNDLENLVSETMLKLIPSFNLKIAKEVKKHLVAIASLMNQTFKEKE